MPRCQACKRKFDQGSLQSSYCKECKGALKEGNWKEYDPNRPNPTIQTTPQPQVPVSAPMTTTVTYVQNQPPMMNTIPMGIPIQTMPYQQQYQYPPQNNVVVQQTNVQPYNPMQYSGYPPTYH